MPKLSIRLSTNDIVLAWSTYPRGFILQTIEDLKSGSTWSNYTGLVDERDPNFRFATIPVNNFGTSVYFRLFWNSPQVGIPRPAVEIAPSGIMAHPK
jgi:hypothetical protein